MPNVNTNEVESNEAKRIDDDHDDNQHENGVSNDFNVNVRLPNGQKVTIKSVNTIEAYSLITQSLKEFIETAHLTSFHLEIASNDDDHEVIIINELVDFNQYAISVITCEHNFSSQRAKIYKLLSSHGFMRVFEGFSRWDDWYIHPKNIATGNTRI